MVGLLAGLIAVADPALGDAGSRRASSALGNAPDLSPLDASDANRIGGNPGIRSIGSLRDPSEDLVEAVGAVEEAALDQRGLCVLQSAVESVRHGLRVY